MTRYLATGHRTVKFWTFLEVPILGPSIKLYFNANIHSTTSLWPASDQIAGNWSQNCLILIILEIACPRNTCTIKSQCKKAFHYFPVTRMWPAGDQIVATGHQAVNFQNFWKVFALGPRQKIKFQYEKFNLLLLLPSNDQITGNWSQNCQILSIS